MALDAQLVAAQQLQALVTSKAEGHSILNYNLANKQYLDALNLGKLLGVDTSKLHPYGGETTNTINVIGTDAMDAMARRLEAAEAALARQQQQQQEPQQGSQGPTAHEPIQAVPPGGEGPVTTQVETSPTPTKSNKLLRNAALAAGLLAGGAAIPYAVDKLSGDPQPPEEEVTVPWDKSKPGEVEVDVY